MAKFFGMTPSRISVGTPGAILLKGAMRKRPFMKIGFLFHLGGEKTRFFVLHEGGIIRYFKSEFDFTQSPTSILRQIPLSWDSTVTVDSKTTFTIQVNISQKLQLECLHEEEAAAWVATLRAVIERIPRRALDGGQIARRVVKVAAPDVSKPVKASGGQSDNDDPFDEDTVEELLSVIWSGDLSRAVEILINDPSLATQRGNIYERLSDGKWRMVKPSNPISTAVEKQNVELIKQLLRAGGQAEIVRQSRISVQVDRSEWAPLPIRESMGMHPMKLDPSFRETMAEMQSELVRTGWKPMSDLDLKYFDIMVNRCGATPDAFMITKGVILEIEPHVDYRMTLDASSKPLLVPNGRLTSMGSLVEEDGDGADEDPESSKPHDEHEAHLRAVELQNSLLADPHQHAKFLEIGYDWHLEQVVEDSTGNIFGENSLLEVEADELHIPMNIATEENLAFFNAKLVDRAEPFHFDVPLAIPVLPVTIMDVGKDYAEHFIMHSAEGGAGMGGAYLEWHDVPHFHMPLNESCGGALVLGLMDEKTSTLRLAGFSIPFGKAVYTKPYTLHNDCFLIGEFSCVYMATEKFATGTVVNRNKENCTFKFID